jgi:hypothetical protein
VQPSRAGGNAGDASQVLADEIQREKAKVEKPNGFRKADVTDYRAWAAHFGISDRKSGWRYFLPYASQNAYFNIKQHYKNCSAGIYRRHTT